MIACLHKFRGDVTYTTAIPPDGSIRCVQTTECVFLFILTIIFSSHFFFCFFSFSLVGVGNVCRARNNSNSKKQEGFFVVETDPKRKLVSEKSSQRGLTRIDHTTLGDPYFSKGKLNVEGNSFPSSSLGIHDRKKRVSVISKIRNLNFPLFSRDC